MRKTLYALLVVLIASCSKKEDVVVPNNVPPPDHSIDSSSIGIYINKVYINTLGREPIGNEKSSGATILKQHNFSVDDRKQFLETIFTKTDYKRNLNSIARIEYLANLDSTDIDDELGLFMLLRSQPQYSTIYATLDYEIGRLNQLKSSLPDLNAGTITYQGLLKRCVNNYFYDQINMGTENFVVSTFQNFLFRYPTTFELASGSNMVNGANAELFLAVGKTKDDYIDIFFNSNDYYEGQVRFVFRKYLFREPGSAEMSYYADIYKNTNDFSVLEKEVFATDEYAGIK
jgi:hypothetical protein